MSIEAVAQVLDSAVDTAGVSTVTSTRTVAEPRQGTVYNPTTFAAGVPVWFHRLHDGSYMAMYKRVWNAATGVYHDGPQLFSAYTESTEPAYVVINPTTGTCSGPFPLPGASGEMTLDAAISRDNYLFTVGTKDGVAWIQHFVITRTGGLQLQGEEAVPMDLHLGLYIELNHLRVLGADPDGHLAQIRKNWGRIGTGADAARQWEYEGPKGWYVDSEEWSLMPGPTGPITCSGPVTMAKFRDRYYLLVTQLVTGAYSAKAYTSRAVDAAWKPFGTDVIPLGDTGTYLGGGAYLQPQLAVSRSSLPDGAQAGFPYVTSVKIESGSDDGILVDWGILSV